MLQENQGSTWGQSSKENGKAKLLKRPVPLPRLGTVGTIGAVSSLP